MRLWKCDRIKYSAEGNRCRVPWIDCTGTEQEVFITPLGVRYERPGAGPDDIGLIPGFR
jgi:hypothetical protein